MILLFVRFLLVFILFCIVFNKNLFLGRICILILGEFKICCKWFCVCIVFKGFIVVFKIIVGFLINGCLICDS